jgi:hypothetical protein
MITFEFSWLTLLTLLVSAVLPLLVGLVTKLDTKPGRRAILLGLFAAITGFLNELITALSTGGSFNVSEALFLWLGVFIISVGVHFGFLKPTGLSTKAQAAFGGDSNLP